MEALAMNPKAKAGVENHKAGEVRRYHPLTAQTPFPLNLDFGDLNATKSKN
jgi:hypothetical protein